MAIGRGPYSWSEQLRFKAMNHIIETLGCGFWAKLNETQKERWISSVEEMIDRD